MLNEVRARHLRKLVIEKIRPGVTVGGILQFEVARREDTIRGLEAQIEREQDEIIYLGSLDAIKLHKEAGDGSDV